jgi:hypothetical protein
MKRLRWVDLTGAERAEVISRLDEAFDWGEIVLSTDRKYSLGNWVRMQRRRAVAEAAS